MFMKLIAIFLGLTLALSACANKATTESKEPKKIILMIADGWGANQIKAADYYLYDGDSAAYEKFPVRFFMATYPAIATEYDKKTETNSGANAETGYDPKKAWRDFNYVNLNYTESAAAGTALATGVKTRNGHIGVDVDGAPLKNISEYAKDARKSVGVVTTVPWVDATPANFGAHNISRKNYSQIALDMLLESKIDVIAGACNPYYDNNGALLKETEINYSFHPDRNTLESLRSGDTLYRRQGTKELFSPADIDGDGKSDPWTFVEDYSEIKRLAREKDGTKRLCIAPKVNTTFQAYRAGRKLAGVPFENMNKEIPTLAECALAALNVLEKNPEGYFLMAEGGAVDWANHDTSLTRMIEEMRDFNQAVDTIIERIKQTGGFDETLLIVCGDHECGYLTGPKERNNSPVENPVINNGYRKIPSARYNSTTHTNSLIPVFAIGAGAEGLAQYADEFDPVRGAYVQNTEIAKLIISILENRAKKLRDK